MRSAPAHRSVALLAAMLVGISVIALRLGVLQVRDHGSFTKRGLDQRVHAMTLPASRGEILDRQGTPLAITLEARDVYVDPSQVADPATEAETIGPLLGLDPGDAAQTLRSGGTFAYVKRQVDLESARQLDRMHLPGIGVLPIPKRYYPAGALAPQVLGFVGVDGTGLDGLEAQYDDVLAGRPGERTVELSPDGQPIAQGLDAVVAPVPGSDLVTTIDRPLQFEAQRYLQEAVDRNHAKGGTVIAMDPRNGDVLAMANYPWFDPNRYLDSSQDQWRNRAITDAFEPGSISKVITAAAAIESGAVSLSRRFQVPDAMRVEDYTIHDSHPHPIQSMTLSDIITQSSNIGIAEVAKVVGSARLEAALSRFGFGRITGVGFPGEAPGVVPGPSDWNDVVRSTVAYGQGISVTALQMTSVYCTIANGGTWVQPRLVRGTIDSQGAFRPSPRRRSRSVIRPETAATLTRMLELVVDTGTGQNARIAGYGVAGKTGTAVVPDPAGGYYPSRYIASFIGFLPASAPRLVVAAILDQPATQYGGIAAAPLFRDVATYAIRRVGFGSRAPTTSPPPTLPVP